MPLKRGRYIHMHHDTQSGDWVFFNLITQIAIRANVSLSATIYDILNSSNLDERLRSSSLPFAISQKLLNGKFVIEDSFDELAAIDRMFLRNKTNNTMLSLAIVTNLQCNLRCTYCYQEHVDEYIREADCDAIITYLCRKVEEGVRNITLSWWGGEPLLNTVPIEILVDKVLPLFQRRGVHFKSSIATNGVLLTTRNAELLRRASVSPLQITIDGPRRLHDTQRPKVGGQSTYDSIMTGIRRLRSVYGTDNRYIRLRTNINVADIDIS